MEYTKEQIEELQRIALEHKSMLAKMKEQETDAIKKAEIDKIVSDMILKLHPPEPKMIFGGKTEPKEGEVKVSFAQFLKKVKMHDAALLKTVMSEGSNAQGGYTVPTEYGDTILGALNNEATLPAKTTKITQKASTMNLPAWLTDLTIHWIEEDATKTLTKPTLTKLALVLKKMGCIVPFTDELLDDNICDLSGQVEELVGENMGLAIEQQALSGNTDPFVGVINSGASANAQAAANLAYDDLVDCMYNGNVLNSYRKTAEWWLNLDALKLIMKLKDGNNLPLWNLNIPSAGVPSTILGKPYNLTDGIATAVTTTIVFGDAKYIVMGNPAKNADIQVLASQSATDLSTSAFMLDETWFRFVKRVSLAVLSQAFSLITGVK